MNLQSEPLLTVRQLAGLFNMTPSFIYDHLKEIPHVRLGRAVRFRLSHVEAWLETIEITAGGRQ